MRPLCPTSPHGHRACARARTTGLSALPGANEEACIGTQTVPGNGLRSSIMRARSRAASAFEIIRSFAAAAETGVPGKRLSGGAGRSCSSACTALHHASTSEASDPLSAAAEATLGPSAADGDSAPSATLTAGDGTSSTSAGSHGLRSCKLTRMDPRGAATPSRTAAAPIGRVGEALFESAAAAAAGDSGLSPEE